jgi:hypothetical protein
LLLEEKESLAHGEGLARVGPGQRCGVNQAATCSAVRGGPL